MSANWGATPTGVLFIKGVENGNAAIHIHDGGESITVDGIVTSLPSGIQVVSGSVGISNFPSVYSMAEFLPNTFYVLFDNIIPATNKYMATLFNTSASRKVVIQKVHRFNWQVTAVAGAVLEQYVARITARTPGVTVTCRSMDTADVLSSGISSDTNSSSVTENHIIRRLISTNEELTITEKGYGFDGGGAFYERQPYHKGITLRQNEGVTIRNVTNSAVGAVSYMIEFTDEPA